jgi:hypothetical protein
VGNAHQSSIMEVILTCHVCGSIGGDNGISSYSEFNIAGYQSPRVEWSDSHDKIPPENEYNHWMRSEKNPEVGEQRIVFVQHPFCENDEKDFWTFYQPALTSLNGIQDHIEEIDNYAFVKCKLLKILLLENNKAWLQILVDEVIFIKDAQNLIPIRHEESSFLKKLYDFSPYEYKSYGNWEYYFGSAEGDIGNWLIIYKNDLDVHLISFGEWMFHQESAYLGNLIISEETYQSLVRDRKLYDYNYIESPILTDN